MKLTIEINQDTNVDEIEKLILDIWNIIDHEKRKYFRKHGRLPDTFSQIDFNTKGLTPVRIEKQANK